jgi:regulator of cell morphogenesis and NO signaling
MTVGRLAAEHPLTTRVFARYGIDYCCGGGRPIAEACRAKGLDVEKVLGELSHEMTTDTRPAAWDRAPLEDLIDHILIRYHQPLHEELARLQAMTAKVVRVHGDKDPERLPRLLEVITGLRDELEDHMRKEEGVLFPLIRRGAGRHLHPPVGVMLHEHEETGEALRQIRALTDGYVAPEHACTTWRALWHGLAVLETDLHDHIHLENNILFPRALAN